MRADLAPPDLDCSTGRSTLTIASIAPRVDAAGFSAILLRCTIEIPLFCHAQATTQISVIFFMKQHARSDLGRQGVNTTLRRPGDGRCSRQNAMPLPLAGESR